MAEDYNPLASRWLSDRQFIVDDERRSIVIWSVSECSKSMEDNENDKY
jgi:hypothetical protein